MQAILERNLWWVNYCIYAKSSVNAFRGFLGSKNQVRIRIDGALDVDAKSETTISLSVKAFVTCFHLLIVPE